MSADVITKFTYLEHGKKAPPHSSFKGIITTKSIIGFTNYGKRAESRNLSNEAKAVIDSNKNFFNYTKERIGATKTYSSLGWIDSPEKDLEFRETIANAFNKDGDLLWVPVLSLKDFMTSTEMKLFNEEDYAAVFEKVLPVWFKRTGFKNENMVWWMDHHVNTDNPHIHFNFLEKNQTIKNGKLSMKNINDFKSMFWSEVFSKKRFLENTGKAVEAGFKNKDLLKQETYKLFKEKMKSCTETEFVGQLQRLYQELPATGRLQYNSTHMIPYRKEIDKVVEYLLRTPEVNERYKNFLNSLQEFDEVRSKSLTTSYTSMTKTEDKKLRVLLANTILNEFKHINHEYWENLNKGDINAKNIANEIGDQDLESRIIPISKSLIKSDHNGLFFMRVPGGGKYIYLDKSKCTLISVNKGFYTAEITNQDSFNVYDSDGRPIDEKLDFLDMKNSFSDGQPYLDSLEILEKNRLERAELWEQRQKYWVANNHNWKSSSTKAKRASFAWINEIEQEVDQARNEFFNGREYTL